MASSGLSGWSFLLLSCIVSSVVHSDPTYQTLYFEQKIDHFGFYEDSTFKQRYLVSDAHWRKPGGPILFYTGNEGDITLFSNNTGFMWDVAEELGAKLVFAEHRYYGESLPYGNLSYSSPKYLNFLTSEQALADFAILIRYLKEDCQAKTSPVIAIGGSYGGMLAAWLRMKYPQVVVGALAASAPIWMFEDLVPCNLYFQIVTNTFQKSGSGCAESIRKSWSAINRMLASDKGIIWLSGTFHLCSPLKNHEDGENFKSWLTETWVNLAMVDYPYAANFLEPLPAWPVEEVCKYLRNPHLDDQELLQNIFQAINLYYNYTGDTPCLNTSETAVGSLDDLGWSYQACTEMVMPLCSDGVNDMFEPDPWDLKAFSDDCYKQWGIRPRPKWITSMYGGKNISAASNIIFSNGDLDPWSAGGVKQNLSDSLISILITDGAHHLDLRSNNAHDPRAVIEARALEVAIMKKWMKEHSLHLNGN